MFLATTGNYKLAKRIPLFLLVLYINTAQRDEASWFIQQGSLQRVDNTVFKVSLVYSFIQSTSRPGFSVINQIRMGN